MPNQPEDSLERRRASVRASVARHKERLGSLSPIEQAAWKARASLGEAFDPYTPAERSRLERIRRMQADLAKEVETLNATMLERYRHAIGDDPRLAVILAELEHGKELRVSLKPH